MYSRSQCRLEKQQQWTNCTNYKSLLSVCLKTCVLSRSQTVVCYRRAGYHHDRGPHPLLRPLMEATSDLPDYVQRLFPVRTDRWTDTGRGTRPSSSPSLSSRRGETGGLQRGVRMKFFSPPAFNDSSGKTNPCCCLWAEELHTRRNPSVIIYFILVHLACFWK